MITLTIRGRQMTFTEEDITALVEEHLYLGPVTGRWFKVDPKTIDWSLFEKKRENPTQENVRKYILKAEDFVKKYDCDAVFETLIPEKTWEAFKISEFIEFAEKNGGELADMNDQALEWAQRLSNGETWEEVCNTADISPWFRIIEFTPSCYRLIGGSTAEGYCYPATCIGEYDYCANYVNGGLLGNAVPLIKRYVKAD